MFPPPDYSQRDDDDGYDGPSKTQVKQAMHALQDIGTQLLALSKAQRNGIAMDARLRDALREHGRMPTRESKRRHMQFIGRLIREGDDEQNLILALEQIRAGTTRLLADAERWRTSLLEEDSALTQWMEEYPQTVAQPFRNLIRSARRELAKIDGAEAGSEAARRKSKAYKDLFQSVRDMLAQSQG